MIITNNKQIKGAFYSYVHGVPARSLDEVYCNYSNAKRRAWIYCEDLMKEYEGSDMRILSYNSQAFTIGFIGYVNGLKHFFYITKDYNRAMPLEKLDKITGEVLSVMA